MTLQGFHGFLRGFLFAAAVLLCVLSPVRAQSTTEKGAACREDIAEADGFKIRDVKVKVRYLPDLRHPIPAEGTGYSPALVTTLVEDVSQALTDEAMRENEEGQTEHRLLNTINVGRGKLADAFGFGIKLVTSCTTTVEESECRDALGEGNTKCVDVAIHAFSVRVNTGDPMSNLLNIPRSNRPTFLSRVPGPLLAFNPRLGVEYDRTFGPTAAFELSTNILDFRRNIRSLPLRTGRTRLDLRSIGRRSLNDEFYETASKLSFERSFAGLVEQLSFDAEFEANHHPQALGDYLRNAVRVGGSAQLRTNFTMFQAVSINARYRRSSNRFRGESGPEDAREDSFEGTALLDGRLWRGTNRLGLWVDVNSPNRIDGYKRAAMLWGYQREFIIIPNQTIGLEVLAGAGRTWGNTPQYARFYGGNWTRNFLYEGKESPAVSAFPRGPLIRSFGSGRATAGTGSLGATAYWNANLNVTIPVPAWSSPIVPDISISLPQRDTQGRVVLDNNQDPLMQDRPLRVILKNQGQSSLRVLERIFIRDGLSPEDAQAKARRELQDINAILGFIADQANIYSFKPLFMFDAARLNSPEVIENRTRFAVGGGIQFTLVIAKFEAGYMRTLRPLPGDSKGNVVLRLFFQNLF